MKQRNPHWESQQKGAAINRQKAYKQRILYQELGRSKAQEGNFLHLIGCILYWGEGAKDRVHLRFINTDPYMLKLFMQFLREQLQVEEGLVSLQVFYHTKDESEIARIRQYWMDWLELPQDTHINMQLKIGTTSRKKRYLNGICAIDLNRTEILQHIYGAIQEYIGFEHQSWGK
jgi:hypothetical protein